MPWGFYIIMAAQFFSALADNTLLIAAIQALRELSAPTSDEPLLKTTFVLSYVVLAPLVGAFADSMPKGRVMLISNSIKIVGCLLLLWDVEPLLAYAVVGLGAAAYSPAKYGIVTEYLPANKLVVANGWIEGLTIIAIVLGVVFGGMLIKPQHTELLNQWGLTFFSPGDESLLAMAVSAVFYLIAALLNIWVPDTGVDHKQLKFNPWHLTREFFHCFGLLWKDHLGQISLAVTTLFWGAGATLQFIIIAWAEDKLGLGLAQASQLQGVVAVGIGVGAVVAAKYIPLKNSPRVIILGIAMGVMVWGLNVVNGLAMALPLLVVVGGLAGFFVVPMNALLQHRGHVLMGAGHSIAVQNFNENLSILVMTTLYALLIAAELPIAWVVFIFGLFVASTMVLVYWRHRYLEKHHKHTRLLEHVDHAH